MPLTELGVRQAQAIADAIAAPSRVVSSPLTRARDTAACFGMPVEVDERWVELDYGVHDGAPLRDVPSEVWARWRDDVEFAPERGESLAALGVRVRAACDELADEIVDSDIVVVSHVSPIKAAVAWALGVDDRIAWRMHLEVAAICRIAAGPVGPVLRSFNETSHLADLSASVAS